VLDIANANASAQNTVAEITVIVIRIESETIVNGGIPRANDATVIEAIAAAMTEITVTGAIATTTVIIGILIEAVVARAVTRESIVAITETGEIVTIVAPPIIASNSMSCGPVVTD